MKPRAAEAFRRPLEEEPVLEAPAREGDARLAGGLGGSGDPVHEGVVEARRETARVNAPPEILEEGVEERLPVQDGGRALAQARAGAARPPSSRGSAVASSAIAAWPS